MGQSGTTWVYWPDLKPLPLYGACKQFFSLRYTTYLIGGGISLVSTGGGNPNPPI